MENIVKCNRNLIKKIFFLLFDYKYDENLVNKNNENLVNKNNEISLTIKEELLIDELMNKMKVEHIEYLYQNLDNDPEDFYLKMDDDLRDYLQYFEINNSIKKNGEKKKRKIISNKDLKQIFRIKNVIEENKKIIKDIFNLIKKNKKKSYNI